MIEIGKDKYFHPSLYDVCIKKERPERSIAASPVFIYLSLILFGINQREQKCLFIWH